MEQEHDPQAPREGGRHLTRRSLVKGAAGTAVVGAVAAGSAGIGAAAAHSSTDKGGTAGGGKAAEAVPAADVAAGQFVVHIRDIKAGTLDVYSGDRHMVVTDHDLSSRLAYYTW